MKIVFISTMNDDPWGGSELLWSQAAVRLVRAGHSVSVSVPGWPQPVPQLAALAAEGVKINQRWLTFAQLPACSLKRLLLLMSDPLWRRAFEYRFKIWLAHEQPDLICISNGSCADNLPLLRICRQSCAPYVMIAHANPEHLWPDDRRARILLDLYRNARAAFFVSRGNQRLLETQLGELLPNAEIVRNPFNVDRKAAPAWPATAEPVSLACVGRLDPRDKGQDILLHVLARTSWRNRPLRVSFFGQGRCEKSLRRLTERLQLRDRVRFSGTTNDIAGIWATHHALVLPSRFEGLPLAIVEAMHCGRPAIVTDVAGNAEVVQDGITGFVAEAPTETHLHAALERAWNRREDWQKMGQAAARYIRELVPADPAAEFAKKLSSLTDVETPVAARAKIPILEHELSHH